MTTETKFTVGEYKTRDGRRANVVAVHMEWLFGVVDEGLRTEFPSVWNLAGTCPEGDNQLDLIPPLREIWVIDGSGWNCATKEQAEKERKSFYGDEYKPIIKYREVRDDQA